MSQDSVERLLGRMLTDASFRTDATASLANVCRREGYELTEGELNLVERINVLTLESIVAQLDSGLCRATMPSKKSPHISAGKG
ncbi:MAG: Franean1_4349 family RiPP [Deltaproteobacteria bacterium]